MKLVYDCKREDEEDNYKEEQSYDEEELELRSHVSYAFSIPSTGFQNMAAVKHSKPKVDYRKRIASEHEILMKRKEQEFHPSNFS